MNTRDRPGSPRGTEALSVFHGKALEAKELPSIAVVIPTLDGRKDLDGCLRAIAVQEFPSDRLSVIVVDNGSRDGTPHRIQGRYPGVQVIGNESNLGFAAAMNQGSRAARDARILVFLNNDVRLENGFLRELIAPIARGECTTTSAKMLSWDGTRIDHAGGACNFQGIAIAYGYGEIPGPAHDFPRQCLFACGGAMAMEAAFFERIGGFDEGYFAYYEDLDLGWRTWLAGGSVHYVPAACCIHRHSATSRRFPPEVLRVLQVRNPLLTAFKNYDDANLARVLPALLAMYLHRTWVMARMGSASSFRLQPDSHRRWRPLQKLLAKLGKGHGRSRIGKLAVSDLVGAVDFFDRLGYWRDRRRKVQELRTRKDSDILPLFLAPLWCVEGDERYARFQTEIIDLFDLGQLFNENAIENFMPRA